MKSGDDSCYHIVSGSAICLRNEILDFYDPFPSNRFSFAGSHILLEKLRKYKPKIAVFNGKLIYEVFSGKKEFGFGRQPNLVDGTNTVSREGCF